jgi:Trypsin-like peptidase domain
LITTNIIERVLFVSYPPSHMTGTAFTIEVDGRQYIITANHVVKGIGESGRVNFFFKGGWKEVEVTVISPTAHDVDMRILVAAECLTPVLPIEPTVDKLCYSQDVYFLGFPYKIVAQGQWLNDWRPLPFVKKGIVSLFDPRPDKKLHFYINGDANPGFSGGPIVFIDRVTNQVKVAGVVAQRRVENEPVYDPEGHETGMYFEENTNIFPALDIAHAVEAIKLTPIGPEAVVNSN